MCLTSRAFAINSYKAAPERTEVGAPTAQWDDATNVTYRLDSPAARAFLAPFVALP